ncbi:hypothetical protein OH491_00040 [Termitidicoccus mucosus]|uniref:DUF3352 domain-containing protein n=1 Tax=Termitidicoccus mucosus TaxID=1184151 RepID=A0A178IBG0_9BACT|nr:hypothetical protein AW736_23395 [Opitutaceae bacterium TSB47]
MNKIKRHLLVAAALLAGLLPSARAFGPLANLVGEQAPLVVLVNDVPGLVENWKEGPLARTWNDGQVREFFAPLHENLKTAEWDGMLKQQIGHSAKEILAFVRGGALIAIPSLEGWQERGREEPPVLLVAELGENTRKIEELLTSKAYMEKAKITRLTEHYAGATLYIDEFGGGKNVKSVAWLISDGNLYCSPSRQLVAVALDAARAGGVRDAFGKSERFLRMTERAGNNAHVLAAINFQAIYPVFDAYMKAQAANPENRAGMMIDLANLGSTLGLDALGDIYGAVTLGKDSAESMSGLTYSAGRGLLKMLAFGEGPLPKPAFLPADSLTTVVGKFKISDSFTALEEVVQAALPMIFGYYQNTLSSLNQQYGIDIKRDLVGSLGDDFYMIQRAPAGETAVPGQLDQAVVISLQDERLFASTLGKLITGSGAGESILAKREYLGATLYSTAGAGANAFGWAVANGHLIIGFGASVGTVESVLQGMAGKIDSFWDKASVASALSEVPSDAFGFSYQDTAGLVSNFFDVLALLAKTKQPVPGMTGDDGKTPELVNPEAKPGIETLRKYWDYNFAYNQRDALGIYSRAKTVYKK